MVLPEEELSVTLGRYKISGHALDESPAFPTASELARVIALIMPMSAVPVY